VKCAHESKLKCCQKCDTCCECYQCQYCEKRSPQAQWKKNACPKCGGVYDYILAQEGDD